MRLCGRRAEERKWVASCGKPRAPVGSSGSSYECDSRAKLWVRLVIECSMPLMRFVNRWTYSDFFSFSLNSSLIDWHYAFGLNLDGKTPLLCDRQGSRWLFDRACSWIYQLAFQTPLCVAMAGSLTGGFLCAPASETGIHLAQSKACGSWSCMASFSVDGQLSLPYRHQDRLFWSCDPPRSCR